jgi:hypothetical protein
MNNVTSLPAFAGDTSPAAARGVAQDVAEIMERVVIMGDLSKLTPEERTRYYLSTCRSLGLNPLTRPFEYVRLSGKEVLYAKRDAADQLRKINNISLEIVRREIINGLAIVEVKATDGTGRTDSDIGVVAIDNLRGEALANATMKAITKAKRRVTLSIAGLGFLDESEIDGLPAAQPAPAPVLPKAEPKVGDSQKPPTLVELKLPDGEVRSFPRTWEGIEEMLDLIEQNMPGAILMNNELLDRIANRVPDFADRIAELRAHAAEMLTPASEPEGDAITQKMAERRGAAPVEEEPFPAA